MPPIALILCGDPASTSLVLGALASSTDILHLACPRKALPDLTSLSASTLQRCPVVVLSGVRTNVYLTYLTDALLELEIACASVWVESRPPQSVCASFHPFDLDLLTRIDALSPTPKRLCPSYVAHTLHCTIDLGINEALRIELPLGELTLTTPEFSLAAEHVDCLAEAKAAGERYCQAFNRSLPTACPQ